MAFWAWGVVDIDPNDGLERKTGYVDPKKVFGVI